MGGVGEASEADVEQAVLQVVQVFSKPQPDRERLFKAVHMAVTGEGTIKVPNSSLPSSPRPIKYRS